MRILVIGSKGILGQEFMRQLDDRDVVGWAREDLDITNKTAVFQKVGELKPQAIINCAAYNNVDKAEDEPEVAMAINGEAVGYLARAAAECGATFVHFSTDYVFGGTREDGYHEEDVPDPISKYGESKSLGERKVLEVFDSHPPLIPPSLRAGWPSGPEAGRGGNGSSSPPFEGGVRGGWYIIRTSKLFGLPGTGATSKKSFPELMIKIAKEKGKVEAVDAEAGSPTYVKDLAEATINIIGISPSPQSSPIEGEEESSQFPSPRGRGEGEGQSYPSGIYHITNSGSCTWYEYAKAALEYAGLAHVPVVPVGPDHFPRKAVRPVRVVLLNTKLPPLRPWQEALKEFLG